ncbi:MAG: PAAR domain-containing protein [Rhodothermales bacterium]
MFPASRLTDLHLCPAFSGPAPHLGGPISTPGHATTLIGSLIAARGTDQATCAMGPPDFIVTGAGTCLIGGQPAARMLEKAMHGGVVIWGCFTVLIGGPSAGVTLGNPAAGNAACEAAAEGRTPKSTSQSWDNCGVESARQIINTNTSANISEQALLQQSMNNRTASIGTGASPNNPSTWNNTSGRTGPADRQAILASQGVASTTQPQNMANIEQAVAERRGVISAHRAGALWGTTQGGFHAIVPTGVEYDANGDPVAVIVNDTGIGQCQQRVPIARYQGSLRSGYQINVTNNQVW